LGIAAYNSSVVNATSFTADNQVSFGAFDSSTAAILIANAQYLIAHCP
jgi:hypothetical protein